MGSTGNCPSPGKLVLKRFQSGGWDAAIVFSVLAIYDLLLAASWSQVVCVGEVLS